MIACTGVTVTYPLGTGWIYPLRDVALTVEDGQAVALMGPSGSGKTTLLRVLSGLQRPQSGEVLIDGSPVEADGDLDPRVSLVYQDYALVSFLSVEQNLQVARTLRGLEPSAAPDVAAALDALGIDSFQARMPATLSGGEQQRVCLARAVLVGSRVLLADEPTGALDHDTSLVLADYLRSLAEDSGLTVLVATHDSQVASRLHAVRQLSDLSAPR